AGRSRHEIEGLIGFFVNLQLVRTDFADDPTFRRLLGRVREATLEAYAYLDLPYEKLVEALQPDRSAGDPSLFQAIFTFQNAPSQNLELPGVTLRPLELESGRETKNAMFDFSAVMWEWGELLTGGLGYDGTLFERATIDVLVDHFLRLLEEIAADPDRRVGDYSLISEAERRQILDDQNRLEVAEALGSEIRKRLEAAARCYLLDRKLRLVPLAGVGEIFLEGLEPASVELPDPAAAAAAWRPHPFTREPGSSLFATGLRGRRRADGRPELLAEPDSAPAVGDRPPATAGDSPAAEAAVVDKRRAGLKSRQSRLSEARKALLARRLRGRSKKPAEGIPRRPVPDPGSLDTAPLSFAQQRLWFLEQLEPGTGLYNIPRPVRLAGQLDLDVLARSLNEIVRRHEILRTTFVSVEGEPLHVIASSLELGLPVVDLRRLTRGAREAESRRLATAELERSFDLSRGPL
ncbi:MAG: hypothetical protein GY856_25470, partial [bacterium]|nr:hypothetical protein [bacterium]